MSRQNSLFFSWDKVDDLPDLKRLKMIFEVLPDEKIIEHLNRKRGRGPQRLPGMVNAKSGGGGNCARA